MTAKKEHDGLMPLDEEVASGNQYGPKGTVFNAVLSPGREHPHQSGEAILRIRSWTTDNPDEIYECNIPMNKVRHADDSK